MVFRFPLSLPLCKRIAWGMGKPNHPIDGAPSAIPAHKAVILFDAVCVLCSANARFVLERDREERFVLASMQSDVGAELFRANGLDPSDPSSILVIEGPAGGGRVRKDSDAVIAIYEGLGWPWRAARVFRLVPAFLRDPIYHPIARNRYRIFGKRESCWVPPERFRARVL